MFVTAAAVLMHITFVHIVVLFYSFTLQIYPKVHATELQKHTPHQGTDSASNEKTHNITHKSVKKFA
jgi:hypothetical protein